MRLALVNKIISEPVKNVNGKCPLCGADVIPKCGNTNVHHWAHKKDKGCDNWSEPETYWHKSWKAIFPTINQEVVIEKNKKKHFADICNQDDIVIELQNSPITSEVIEQRELFYGDRMLWLINGSKYRTRIRLFGNDIIKKINAKEDTYSNYVSLSNPNILEYLKELKEVDFFWEYPVRSWRNAKRPIFLDIGEDYIIWIHKGIGTKSGAMKVYSKESFINKYKGDYYKHKILNDNGEPYKYDSIIKMISDGLWNKFFKDWKGYSYPPELAYKVVDNVSQKTYLRRVTWNQVLIPNANRRGIYFLFCYNEKEILKNKVFVEQSIETSIGKSINEIIQKLRREKTYTIKNTDWVVEYIASIPLKKEDTFYFDKPIKDYFKLSIGKERLIL